ncbi:glycosyltransferase [Chryseobacterium nepalense]|uniref:glycosyltransferase n=1 Tax=Chryseobacterium nepalense TaxID=1854498 RepID=UPI002DFBD543|nr:putative colanic acid biosynthesis glycosyltransferase [Chryseobacterium nepalense]
MKIVQISSEVNIGSVGRIAEQIGENILNEGWESFIAYGRENLPSKSSVFPIGNKLDVLQHVLLTRLTDKHGFGSVKATANLIDKIQQINPDIIHLQHLHGYYINIEHLFQFLKQSRAKIVWTFHDCWSFTGHCAYYDLVGCDKWKSQCFECPQLKEYPQSLYIDRSKKNFLDKKRLFTSLDHMTIVPVSNWLEGEVRKSFLKDYTIQTIHNGIDIGQFTYTENTIKKDYKIEDKFLILGVANPWDKRKGLKYFIELSKKLSDDYKILLVGLTQKQIKKLPQNIIGLERTKNVKELSSLYSAADVFVNPTLEDTFPTTNLESQSCGTPVITFKTGGSPEALDQNTGIVVEKGNTDKLIEAIEEVKKNTKSYYSENCRKRVAHNFDKKNAFKNYIELYKKLVN